MAGISSGGAMTSILASCAPDVFAAGAVHSGLAYDAANNIVEALAAAATGSQTDPNTAGERAAACQDAFSRPMPVMILHGTADFVVAPANGGDTAAQMVQMNDLSDDGEDNDSVTLPVPAASEQVADGYTYTVAETMDGERTLITYVVVDGLSHMWSGGTGTFPLSDPRAPNASQMFWDFLSRHSRTQFSDSPPEGGGGSESS